MLKILEKAFVVFALMYFAGGLVLVLQPDSLPLSDDPPGTTSVAMLHQQEKSGGDTTEQKNRLKLGVEIGIYAITAGLILCHLRQFLRLVRPHKLLILLVAWAMVSTLWSDDPGFTARRSLVLIASTCFGVYLATRFTMREILRLVCVVGVIAALASLMIVWRKPEFGISSGATDGAWQGIFGQKNTLGRFMALELLALGIGAIAEKKWRWLYIAGGILCLPLAILARDATALLALPVLAVLCPLFHLARKRSLVRMVAIISAVSAAAAGFLLVAIIEPSKLLLLIGKDSTLSGRTDIWTMVWQKFLQQPWLGYGYSAFWMGKDGKESAAIWQALKWSVPHSHNGYLDVLVEVGIVGLVLFLVGCVVFFRQALRCARASNTVLGLFPLLYLSFTLLTNCSEGTIIKQESLFWVLYAAIWVLTTRWLELASSRSTQRTRARLSSENLEQPKFTPAWQFRSPTTPGELLLK
jgi:O-antigen ligase